MHAVGAERARCTSGSARPTPRPAARRRRRSALVPAASRRSGMPMPPSLSDDVLARRDARPSTRATRRAPRRAGRRRGRCRAGRRGGRGRSARPGWRRASVDELGELRVVHPGVEAEAARRRARRSRGGSRPCPSRPGGGLVCDRRTSGLGVPGVGVADAAEPPAAGLDVGGEDVGDLGRRRRSAKPTMPAIEARPGRRADDELGLADGAERLGPVGRGSPTRTRRTPSRRRRAPLPVSARSSASMYGLGPGASQRWWCGSTMGRSGSRTSSFMAVI